jgi:hypothetical protein
MIKKLPLYVSAILCFWFSKTASSQVSLTTLGSAYTQDFNTLSNVAGSTTNNLTITGWFLTESGGGARDNEQFAVDAGASTTGDMYSYGAAGNTDRALGELRSGTLIPVFGATFTNNTGSVIGSLDISYIGEQWRLGTISRTDQINFEYSLNATDLTTGTWTAVSALNFVTPVTTTAGAKDGNTSPNRTALSTTISSLSIANGATFWIRWTDTDASGADDGLAVDDFSLTPQAALPTLSINDTSKFEGQSGTTSFDFTVNLSAPAPAGGVTFDIATADGTSTTADLDYTSKSLTSQTIAAGSSSYNFTVLVNGDMNIEADETFFVNVTNVTNATVTDGQGQGTIKNDDGTMPIVTGDPSSQTVCAGNSVTFSASSTGTPTPVISWEVSGNSGSSWTAIPAETTDNYTFTASSSDNGKMYRVIYTNNTGADTTVAATLTVNPVFLVNNPQTICENDSYTFNGNVYTLSGNYNDTLQTVNGCDSIIVTQLTVVDTSVYSTSIIGCDSASFNGVTYYSSNTYTQLFTNAAGCDSLVYITATINQSNGSITTVTGCDSAIFNGTTYYADNLVISTFTNFMGCDSAVTTNIVVNYSNGSVETITGCDSVDFNGTMYYADNTVMNTFTNAMGCDSTVTTNIAINYSNVSTETATGCDSVIVNGTTYYADNTVMNTYPNVNGCDSVVTTAIVIKYSSGSIETVTGCDSVSFNGTMYYADNTVINVLTNAVGCDSVVTTTIVVNQSAQTFKSETGCDSVVVNGISYYATNMYTQNLTTINGCDSTLTINVTINSADTTVMMMGSTLMATATSATFQWVDCNNSNLPISGENSSTFSPLLDGNYAVEVTQNGCTSLSSCYTVLSSGISNDNLTSLNLYPNPTNGKVSVILGQMQKEVNIEVTDVTGRILIVQQYSNTTEINLSLENYSSGIYFIKVKTETFNQNNRILKQ